MGSLVTYRLEGPSARIAMDDGKLNVLSLADAHRAPRGVRASQRRRRTGRAAGRDGVLSAGFDLNVLTGPAGRRPPTC